jgi:uncharacterized C2H2 Zn-finger protein
MDGDYPIGRCTRCGYCFMDEKDKQRIRERVGVA